MPAEPQTSQRAVSDAPTGSFVMIASDGVWEVLSNLKAARLVATTLASDGATPALAAEALCAAALAAHSSDNLSAVVLLLN